MDNSNIYIIITAGGVGRRMGGNTAKQFLELTNPQILPENTTRGIHIS